MLSAATEDGEYITLVTQSKEVINELRNRKVFYCPMCKQKVIIKAGTMMVPHFAHHTKSQCDLEQGGESEYHYKGKLLLYNWLKRQQMNVELEAYIPEIKQRPDLLFTVKDKQIAIEFQCATIDSRTIFQRNNGYKRANIIPIWILGANLFKRKSSYHFQTSHFIHSFIHRFSQKYPTTLFFFCPKSEQLSLVQDIIPTNSHRAIAKQSFIPLHQATFYHLFIKKYLSNKELFTIWKDELKLFRLRKRSNFGRDRVWRNWLYKQGLHIDHVSTYIYLPIRSQYIMKVPLWHWQSKFVLEFLTKQSLGTVFSIKQAHSYLRRFKKNKIDQQLIRKSGDPINEYLQLLSQLGILKKMSETEFILVESLSNYKYIDEALKGDNEVLNQIMYTK